MTQKMLIVGGTGLLGCSLVPFLKSKGHQVVSHGNSQASDFNWDCSDRAAVEIGLSKIEPDIVINLTALTNVDQCELNPQLAYEINTKTVEILVNCILNLKKKPFLIHVSTDQVYDKNQGDSREEEIVLRNYYGFSKYCAEMAALRLERVTVLRTNFFGPSMRAGRPSFSDWILKSLKQKDRINLFSDVTFSPLSIQSLQSLIEIVALKKIRGVFNLGSRAGMSKAEFGLKMAETFGLSPEFIQISSVPEDFFKARRPKNMMMNSTRFEHAFGLSLPNLADEIKSLEA